MLASTALCAIGVTKASLAADATWTGTSDSNYNNAANWNPTGPPDGTATFSSGTGSTTPAITLDSSVGAWSFTAPGVSWTIANSGSATVFGTSFNFTGAGISIDPSSGTVTLNDTAATHDVFLNFNNSSSAGSAVINNSATLGFTAGLNFFNSSTAGNATITAGENSFVAFQNTSSGGSARIIANDDGTGSAGELFVSSLASGGTSVGSIEGSGAFHLGSKSLTTGSLNTSTEVSGIIDGSGGSLTKVGTGTLTLSGANTYDNGTTISAGAIQIGNGGTTGSIAGNVTDNALLIFNRSNAYNFSGAISGTGAVEKDGAGTLTLSGNNSFGGGLTINSGAVTLTGSNTYTGGTTIGAGTTLQVGTGGTTGSFTGNVTDSGTLIFNRSDTSSFGGNISGNGVVQKDGAGTLTLSGTNSYNGGTTFNAGAINASSDANLGNASGALTFNGGALQFGASFNLANTRTITLDAGGGTFDTNSFNSTISQAVTGTGGLTKTGAGTLTLAGANDFSGGTTLNSGTLAVSGSGTLGATTNAVTVNGGTLDFGGTTQTIGSLTMTGGTVTNGAASNTNVIMQGGTSIDATFALTGTSTLTKNGAGTATVSAAQSYTGATTINDGTLAFTGSGSAASSAFNLAGANAIWDISGKASGTSTVSLSGVAGSSVALGANTLTLTGGSGSFSGTIGGTGGLVVSGGSQSLNGNNGFSGGVNLTGGTISAGNSNAFGTGVFTATGGTLNIQDGVTLSKNISLQGNVNLDVGGPDTNTIGTYSGVISESGGSFGVTKTGAGTWLVNGAQNYTGGTTISAGRYMLNTADALTAANGAVLINGGELDLFFHDVTTGALTMTGGAIIGSSTLIAPSYTVTGPGSSTIGVILSGNAPLNVDGTLLFLDGPEAYTGGTFVTNGGALFLGDRIGAGINAGAITISSGSALVVPGITLLAGTTINLNGVMSVKDGNPTQGSTGGADIQVSNSGSLNYFDSTTAGSASITNNNFVLFRDTSTAGSANITNNATLQFGFSASAGSAAITNSGALSFFNGSTGGNAIITNSGTLTFNDTSTTGTATINTTGIVNLNSSNATGTATVNVNAGGSLIGNGSVGNTAINAGGTLAPGHSIGTVTVNGNLTFAPGSTYTVEISGNTSDKTNVTGTATINGGTVQVTPLSRVTHATTYSIINAASVSGIFDTVSLTTPLATNPHLSYSGTDVFLTVAPGFLSDLLPPTATGNQKNVAQGIDNAILAGSPLPAGFNALFNAVANGNIGLLDQISGQPATGMTTGTVQTTNSFLGLVLNPFAGAPGGNGGAIGYAREFGAGAVSPEAAAAYAAVTPRDLKPGADTFAHRWSIWAQGYGGYNSTKGDTTMGTADTTARTYGVVTGFDYRAAPDLLLGFALGGGGTNWGLSQGLGGGRSDLFQVGLYGTKQFGNAYLGGALSYAWHDVTTDRTVTVTGTDKLEANFRAQNLAGRVEGGYRFDMPVIAFTPYAALQAQRTHTPAYSETAVSGANTFALSYDARSSTATRTELGAWLDRTVALANNDAIAWRGRAAFAHDHAGSQSMNAAFQTLPGSNFTVNGAAPATNLALLTSGVEYRMASGLSLGAKFDTELASRSQTYAGTGTVRYAW